MAALTQARLQELLDYDPQTGAFTWRADAGRFGRIKAGSRAGGLDKTTGYMQLRVDGERYLQHRLAVLHVTGQWPSNDVDHIDCVRTNNRWTNLRDVPRQVNAQNIRRPHRDNKTGHLGVRRSAHGRFLAELFVNGANRHLGCFDTPDGAHQEYLRQKRMHHTGSTL